MLRILLTALLSVVTLTSYSWNAMGHQLVAQIAYDNLTPKAKRLCNKYNRALNSFSRASSFVAASTWLDSLRFQDVHWFDTLHYIDIPFSNDGSPLPHVENLNALWGINQAISVLKSKASSTREKGLSLRILIHVVGDIHQPLHAAAQISGQYPKGDLGGNLFKLGSNPIGTNLHKYWDNGAGILLNQRKQFQIKSKAHDLENKWSCSMANVEEKPEQWVQSSHHIALTQVYTITAGTTPNKQYQKNAQTTVQKQIVFAGCRLAHLLNDIASV